VPEIAIACGFSWASFPVPCVSVSWCFLETQGCVEMAHERKSHTNGWFAVLAVAVGAMMVLTTLTQMWTDHGVSAEHASSSIWGSAELDAPLENATIEVYDARGHLHHTQYNATSPMGGFMFTVYWDTPEAPERFYLVVEEGTVRGIPFQGTLRTCPQNVSSETYYAVNILTTLAAAYLDSHPDNTTQEAHAAVARFLEAPDDVDPEEFIISPGPYFDASMFMQEAAEHTPFDVFISSLVTEMNTGGTHPFRSLRYSYWVAAGDLIKSGLGIIGKGILSWAGGEAVGWFFHHVLHLGGISGGEKIILKEIRKVNEKLARISQQLGVINSRLTTLEHGQKEIIEMLSEVIQELKELKKEQEISTLENQRTTLLTSLNAPVSYIDAKYDAYIRLTSDRIELDNLGAYVNHTTALMDDIDSHMETNLNMIHNVLMPPTGGMGIMDVWFHLLIKSTFSGDQMFQMYQELVQRCTYLLMEEYKGILLMIDNLHARYKNDTTQAESFWDSWSAKLMAQAGTFLNLTELLAASRVDSLPGEFGKSMSTPEPAEMLPVGDALYTSIWETAGSVVWKKGAEHTYHIQDPMGTLVGLNSESQLVAGAPFIYVADSALKVMSSTGAYREDFRQSGGTLSDPAGLAFDAHGSIYISEMANKSIKKLDRHGNVKFVWKPLLNNGTPYMKAPGQLALHGSYVYILDSSLPAVYVLNTTGALTYAWGTYSDWSEDPRPIHGGFKDPQDIAVAPDGAVYVADTGNAVVQVFTDSGVFIKAIGSRGTGSGEFQSPSSLTFLPDGTLLVADSGLDRIQRFSSDGTFMELWGSESQSMGLFKDVVDMASTSDSVYLLLRNHSRIEHFDLRGRHIDSTHQGSDVLKEPRSLAVRTMDTTFELIGEGSTSVSIRAPNGRYVVPDPMGYLSATGTSKASDALFKYGSYSNSTVTLRSCDGLYALFTGVNLRASSPEPQPIALLPTGGYAFVRMVNFPAVTGKHLDAERDAFPIVNLTTGISYSPESAVLWSGSTVPFYDSDTMKHPSVDVEVMRMLYRVPYGSYHLSPPSGTLVSSIYRGAVLTPLPGSSTATLGMIAYLPDASTWLGGTDYSITGGTYRSFYLDYPYSASGDAHGGFVIMDESGVKHFNGGGRYINTLSIDLYNTMAITLHKDRYYIGYISGYNKPYGVAEVALDGRVLSTHVSAAYGSAMSRIAVDSSGSIYIPRRTAPLGSEAGAEVIKIDTSGNVIKTWTVNPDIGRGAEPFSLCTDGDHLVVADGLSLRILVYDLDGNIKKVVRAADVPGGMGTLVDVAADASGNIYALDQHGWKVHVFTKELTYITTWDVLDPRYKYDYRPTGLTLDVDGLVIVVYETLESSVTPSYGLVNGYRLLTFVPGG